MKRLGIDARLYRQTGVGVYIRNLLYYVEKYIPSDVSVFVYLRSEDLDSVSFSSKNFTKRKADFQWHTVSEQLGFLSNLLKDKLDLMHFTYFSYPVFYPRPFISTIHDLTPYLFKTGRASTKGGLLYKLKHLFFGLVLKSQIARAKAIITPTKTIKNQILEHFGSKHSKKIFPIPEGVNEEISKIRGNDDLKKKFKKNFFVYIGNFYPHKNVENLIRAFAFIREDVELVLVGPDDFFAERIQKLINEQSLGHKVKLYKNPTLEDLVFFYKNAKALINPSLSEGFGLTTIEAAFFNLPVIASKIEVFEEVLEGNYVSFNPHDEKDIAGTIYSFLKHQPSLDYSFLKKYSFDSMTKKTVTLYATYLKV